MQKKSSPAFPNVIRGLLGQTESFDFDGLSQFLNDVSDGVAADKETLGVLTALSTQADNPLIAEHIIRHIEAESATKLALGTERVVNIVGTGGGRSSFNISTTSAFVAAAAGVQVLKSGSASYNSSSGAVDFLNSAGIRLVRSGQEIEDDLAEFGIAFYMPGTFSKFLKRCAIAAAPQPLKHFAPYLNRIGPCLRLFGQGGQVVGVSSTDLMPFYQEVFQRLERQNTWLVSSDAGYDEACSFSRNTVEKFNGQWEHSNFYGQCFGFTPATTNSLEGGSPQENVAITRRVLSRSATRAARETVELNAALLIQLSTGEQALNEPIARAREAIASGKALDLFDRMSDALRMQQAS